MNRKVKHIKRKKGFKNIYIVDFDDGFTADLSDEALVKNGFYVGNCATEESVNRAVKESQHFICREKAYRYIEKVDKSIHEIKKYLLTVSPDLAIAEKIIQEIKENHLIDERLIIENYIMNSLSKKRGNLRIKYDLMTKGFCEKDIDEIISMTKDETFIQNAFEIARKKYTSYKDKDKKNPGKLANYLFGQGYDEDVVEKVVNALYNGVDS